MGGFRNGYYRSFPVHFGRRVGELLPHARRSGRSKEAATATPGSVAGTPLSISRRSSGLLPPGEILGYRRLLPMPLIAPTFNRVNPTFIFKPHRLQGLAMFIDASAVSCDPPRTRFFQGIAGCDDPPVSSEISPRPISLRVVLVVAAVAFPHIMWP